MAPARAIFDEFLKSGSFGGVAVGSTIRDVEDILGAPDDVGRGSKGWQGLRYDDLQIWWRFTEPVHSIGIYFRRAPNERPLLPHRLHTEVPFSCATRRSDLESYLNQHDIPWTIDERLANVTNLRIGSCVTASFDPESGFLESIIATAN